MCCSVHNVKSYGLNDDNDDDDDDDSPRQEMECYTHDFYLFRYVVEFRI